MTVSLYMVGIACSQLIMGPLSDKFGRRPVLLAGLGLMVVASVGCIFAETLPQLIAARFLQALGGATGMVVSRAIIRDLYSRDRVGSMISLVIAVMMIAQMLSPLTGGLLETAFGWRAIFYFITAASLDHRRGHRRRAAGDARATASRPAAFAAMSAVLLTQPRLHRLCAVPGAGLADHLHLRRRRPLYRGDADGPHQRRIRRVVCDHRPRLSWSAISFCARFAPRHPLEKLIWFGLALQFAGALLNLVWGVAGLNQAPAWLFGTQMIVMFANAFVMSNVGGRRHQRPPRGRRHRIRRDGISADGARRAGLAVRRLSRRPFRHARCR